jgi:hypothetical protein
VSCFVVCGSSLVEKSETSLRIRTTTTSPRVTSCVFPEQTSDTSDSWATATMRSQCSPMAYSHVKLPSQRLTELQNQMLAPDKMNLLRWPIYTSRPTTHPANGFLLYFLPVFRSSVLFRVNRISRSPSILRSPSLFILQICLFSQSARLP